MDPIVPVDGTLEKKLLIARRELLETSTRSRLLHTPLGSPRAKIIEVAVTADQIFDTLVIQGKKLGFRASSNAAKSEETPELFAVESIEEPQSKPVGRLEKLQTNLSPEKLQHRLRTISYDAETFENEQGVNILYLALGFLQWFEPADKAKARFAPLVLIPLKMQRETAAANFTIAYSGEELNMNLSLSERLKEDHIILPELPDVDELVPSSYFEQISRAIRNNPDWSVKEDTAVLGFFSFAKLMMYLDLDPKRWPLTKPLQNHPLISGLMGDGFGRDDGGLIPDDAKVEDVISLKNYGHIVDADSSQMLAIENVRLGRNLVIQGPPGTGKSQTITNLIASAVREGKRVLFVAEKLTALRVVRSNLDRVGIGSICLELHSHKAKKKVVLEALRDSFESDRQTTIEGSALLDRLDGKMHTLNGYAERIHRPLEPSCVTPFEIFGRLAKLAAAGISPPAFVLDNATQWSKVEVEDRSRRVNRLAQHVTEMGAPKDHPWLGVHAEIWLPQDVQRITQEALHLADSLESLKAIADQVLDALAVTTNTIDGISALLPFGEAAKTIPSIDRPALASNIWLTKRAPITALVRDGKTFKSIRERLHGIVRDEAWDADVSKTTDLIRTRAGNWFRWFDKDYRTAVHQLKGFCFEKPPRSTPDRLTLLEKLSIGQSARAGIRAGDAIGSSAFGHNWQGENSDWVLLEAIDEWDQAISCLLLPTTWRTHVANVDDTKTFATNCSALSVQLAKTSSQLVDLIQSLSLDVEERFGTQSIYNIDVLNLAKSTRDMAANASRFQEWLLWVSWSAEARAADLNPIVDRLFDGRLDPTLAYAVFDYARHEALARQVFLENPQLAKFDGRTHEAILKEFKALDLKLLELTRKEVLSAVAEGLPTEIGVGEFQILRREWEKQRNHLPLRKLVKSAGRAMQRLKPVWMMSPMSLAQFIEPGELEFDLVLMDEASQIRPVEALGAVARANQLVVVGDDKQLPPTSFFDRLVEEDEITAEGEEETQFHVTDVESILGLCNAQGVPSRMLRWHYRSQHESLIAVSNLEFYKRLFIVPSADSEGLGLHFKKVDGVYDRGHSATNRIEAKKIAEAVMNHANKYKLCDPCPEGMSLGVGTFSVAQREAILDELELLRRATPELESFFASDSAEPFFVRNLESIQGEERDVMLISVGYGKDKDGYMAMSFGPLSTQGGERRLNVLISRARRRCEVFSSITAADIDLGKTQAVGVRVLKTFLQYAELGYLEHAKIGERQIDSDFEADVGDVLARLGYDVQHQVGVAGFFVDIGVKDPDKPGRYLLGVECDGATYHSSRSARDRDRLREQVLVARNWRIHRVWSTDWFKRRDDEITRLIRAINSARSNTDPSPLQTEIKSSIELEQSPSDPSDDREIVKPGTYEGGSEDSLAQTKIAVTAAGRPNNYVESTIRERWNGEVHEMPKERLFELLVRIVQIEGPIHKDELARRVASACGKERAGNRVQTTVKSALAVAVKKGELTSNKQFIDMPIAGECLPRNRSDVTSLTLRQPEMIPPVEIQAAIRSVVSTQIGADAKAVISEVARLFGFKRTGNELQKAFELELRAALGDGVIVLRHGDKLYPST